MIQDLLTIYQDRKQFFVEEAHQFKKRHDQLAFARLGLFVVLLGVAIWFGTINGYLVAGWVILSLLLFNYFVRYHQDIQEKMRLALNKAAINEAEYNAQKHQFQQFQSGEQYLDHSHPYAVDLDLFGSYSFFQYLNRTVTHLGADQLAHWLLHPASQSGIKSRQQLFQGLSGQLEWRQHFQALGWETLDRRMDLDTLQRWMNTPNYLIERPFLAAMRWIIPLWSILFLVWIAPYFDWFITLLCFLPAAFIMRQTFKEITKIHEQTAKAQGLLSTYAGLFAHMEFYDFDHREVIALQNQLKNSGVLASKAMARLSYMISQLNLRYNAFAAIFNLLGMWDFHWVYRLEQWKIQHRASLNDWFEVLQVMDAATSMATLVYNHPDWTFPEIKSVDTIHASALAHPLIPKENRVANPFEMMLKGHIHLVTGSNMAGKSTFLRTVGLNMVLTMAGAPVCAKRLVLPPIQVYTSMRTTDALHENASSFFAELKRLKFIIEAVENPKEGAPKPFFLLDEILKGTNSKDRHTGGRALILQLIKANGAGIIATHDLELGALEAQHPTAIQNWCMEVDIIDGQLHFDYKIKPGVSQSFNATILMQQMGINIDADLLAPK